MKLNTSVFLVMLLCGSIAWAAGDAAAGKALYPVCATCHGANGEGNKLLNSPRLVGQEDWYLTRQINNFKDGKRGAHAEDLYGLQMAPMVAGLADDAAVENVVAYITTLEAPLSEATVKGDAKRGKALYGLCAGCHGSKAEGIKAFDAPKLAGQSDWYLVRQLQNYQKGIRGTAKGDIYGMQMAPMARFTDEQVINDLVVYINSLSK